MPENDGSIGPTDIAILSARMGVMRMGASRMGFYPDDVTGSGDEPGEYVWKEVFPPETTWTLVSLYSFCGQRPVASFTDIPDPSNALEDVQFTDTSTGDITFWHWTFGDGAESYEQNPVHAYTDGGTYTVKLAVSGPRGSDIVSGTHVVSAAGTGTVRVLVRNEYTPYLGQDATVTLTGSIDGLIGSQVTDENGYATFLSVNPQDVDAVVPYATPPGWETNTDSGTVSEGVTLDLTCDAILI